MFSDVLSVTSNLRPLYPKEIFLSILTIPAENGNLRVNEIKCKERLEGAIILVVSVGLGKHRMNRELLGTYWSLTKERLESNRAAPPNSGGRSAHHMYNCDSP